MDYKETLVFWKTELEAAKAALSRRTKNAYVDNYQQNGVTMEYSKIKDLRVHLSYCERQVAHYESLVNNSKTSILGKGVFIR